MTDQYSGNTSGNLSFDPNNQGQGQGPTQGQGQGQGQYNVDPTNRGNLAASDIRSEGRDPTQGQGQGQLDPATRDRQGGNQHQVMTQSADPARGRFDDRIRSTGQGGGQDYRQEDEWRQGGQPAGDSIPHGGGGGAGGDPRQGGRKDQVSGGLPERFGAGNYGPSTGAGPGDRPGVQEIRGDGGFGAKPPFPERMMGAAEKMVGKATGNTAMYERGQQHKTGGY